MVSAWAMVLAPTFQGMERAMLGIRGKNEAVCNAATGQKFSRCSRCSRCSAFSWISWGGWLQISSLDRAVPWSIFLFLFGGVEIPIGLSPRWVLDQASLVFLVPIWLCLSLVFASRARRATLIFSLCRAQWSEMGAAMCWAFAIHSVVLHRTDLVHIPCLNVFSWFFQDFRGAPKTFLACEETMRVCRFWQKDLAELWQF